MRTIASVVTSLMLLLPACVHADETPAPGEPDLYVEAMRAISDGRDRDAQDALRRMAAKGPEHASEWLDLAMVRCALGQGQEAEQLFRTIEERFDPPQGIRELINQQRALGCKRRQPRAALSLALGRGFDRNVNQGASNPSYMLGGTGGATLDLLPEFLPQADQYTSLSAAAMREISPGGTVAFAQGLLRRNDRMHAYNTASVFGGVEHPWSLGRWKLRGTAFAGALTLGGRLYQEQAQLQLKVTPPLPLPKNVEFHAVAGAAHVKYKTLTGFDADTGELRGVLAYRGARTQLQASAGVQNDHATGQRPGGDREGWSLGLSAYRRLSSRWQLEADLSRQNWHGDTPYAAPLINQIRRQDTLAGRLTMVYLLNQNQSLQLEARRVRNKENISIFEYNNRILQLSWQWHGF